MKKLMFVLIFILLISNQKIFAESTYSYHKGFIKQFCINNSAYHSRKGVHKNNVVDCFLPFSIELIDQGDKYGLNNDAYIKIFDRWMLGLDPESGRDLKQPLISISEGQVIKYKSPSAFRSEAEKLQQPPPITSVSRKNSYHYLRSSDYKPVGVESRIEKAAIYSSLKLDCVQRLDCSVKGTEKKQCITTCSEFVTAELTTVLALISYFMLDNNPLDRVDYLYPNISSIYGLYTTFEPLEILLYKDSYKALRKETTDDNSGYESGKRALAQMYLKRNLSAQQSKHYANLAALFSMDSFLLKTFEERISENNLSVSIMPPDQKADLKAKSKEFLEAFIFEGFKQPVKTLSAFLKDTETATTSLMLKYLLAARTIASELAIVYASNYKKIRDNILDQETYLRNLEVTALKLSDSKKKQAVIDFKLTFENYASLVSIGCVNPKAKTDIACVCNGNEEWANAMRVKSIANYLTGDAVRLASLKFIGGMRDYHLNVNQSIEVSKNMWSVCYSGFIGVALPGQTEVLFEKASVGRTEFNTLRGKGSSEITDAFLYGIMSGGIDPEGSDQYRVEYRKSADSYIDHMGKDSQGITYRNLAATLAIDVIEKFEKFYNVNRAVTGPFFTTGPAGTDSYAKSYFVSKYGAIR